MKHILTKSLFKSAFVALALVAGSLTVSAQNSLPAPGSGGGYTPSGGLGPNGIGWNPGPVGPANWGSPWNTGINPAPPVVVNSPFGVGNSINQGITKVIACGYDAQGVWRVLPMLVSYQYDGVQYNVNVLNAWNPWTDQWDRGIDTQAFNTSYILRNVMYDFYVVLPYGTFYFNLA